MPPLPAHPTVRDVQSHVTILRELVEYLRFGPPETPVPGTELDAGCLAEAYEAAADRLERQLADAIVHLRAV